MNPIYFYSTREIPYGVFSNFAPYGIEMDGVYWRTTEHYFQAMKFITTDPTYSEQIRGAHTPKQAANMGRDRAHPLRSDWEQVKDDIMYQAVLKKFQTHEQIREILLSTGDAELVEKTTGDYYWGCGTNGTGKNMLGKILMQVRGDLRE